jgi:transposase InsO family protein
MNQKYQFIASPASQYPVSLLCRVLGLARSGYYAWRTRAVSGRRQHDQQLSEQMERIFRASHQRYGSPRVHAELREQGIRCGRKRVARLMRQAELMARRRRRTPRTTDSHHKQPLAANLLERRFLAPAPNEVWVADITYLATEEGFLYLAVVLDLFARRVVGWSMQAHLERALVLAALEHALQCRKPARGLLHHSDRGSQYARGE